MNVLLCWLVAAAAITSSGAGLAEEEQDQRVGMVSEESDTWSRMMVHFLNDGGSCEKNCGGKEHGVSGKRKKKSKRGRKRDYLEDRKYALTGSVERCSEELVLNGEEEVTEVPKNEWEQLMQHFVHDRKHREKINYDGLKEYFRKNLNKYLDKTIQDEGGHSKNRFSKVAKKHRVKVYRGSGEHRVDDDIKVDRDGKVTIAFKVPTMYQEESYEDYKDSGNLMEDVKIERLFDDESEYLAKVRHKGKNDEIRHAVKAYRYEDEDSDKVSKERYYTKHADKCTQTEKPSQCSVCKKKFKSCDCTIRFYGDACTMKTSPRTTTVTAEITSTESTPATSTNAGTTCPCPDSTTVTVESTTVVTTSTTPVTTEVTGDATSTTVTMDCPENVTCTGSTEIASSTTDTIVTTETMDCPENVTCTGSTEVASTTTETIVTTETMDCPENETCNGTTSGLTTPTTETTPSTVMTACTEGHSSKRTFKGSHDSRKGGMSFEYDTTDTTEEPFCTHEETSTTTGESTTTPGSTVVTTEGTTTTPEPPRSTTSSEATTTIAEQTSSTSEATSTTVENSSTQASTTTGEFTTSTAAESTTAPAELTTGYDFGTVNDTRNHNCKHRSDDNNGGNDDGIHAVYTGSNDNWRRNNSCWRGNDLV
ncbi:hypothetical protein pipiens_006395 [Culex pipiens pipiens]|uniref:Uncharacterized protein n=1 Tax=Culex pipiens pipiens TaxID=38569 RepID=A0ABD1DQ04_CULPP